MVKARGVPHLWPRGAVLMREGEPADRVVLIERGLVKITSESESGYTSMLAMRGPNELVGELSCLDGRPRSATATAMGPGTGVVVPAGSFLGLLEQQNGLALAVLRIVIDRLRDADVQRADLGARSTAVRTAWALAQLAGRYGVPPKKDGAWVLAITQQELAGAVGSSRESVVRVLRLLGEEGLITTERGRILVHDLPALAVWQVGDGS